MAGKGYSGIGKRYPVVEGIFYPGNKEELISILASWGLKEGSSCSSSGGQAIIAPHAAWNISGSIAGAAFASAQKRKAGIEVSDPMVNEPMVQTISRVILLGPCHGQVEEGIYLSESVSFQTPLGDLSVDMRLNREMASCSTLISINDIPHLSEHCLEVLLPLVKYCFGRVRIVPILVSGESPVLVTVLAGALRLTLEKYMRESLIVISSNISRNHDPALALSKAEEFRSSLVDMDTRGFLDCLARGRFNACGAVILGALLESGLLNGKRFSTLTPPFPSTGEQGDTFYYGAFACDAFGG